MAYRVDISIPALQDAEIAFLRIRDFNPETAKSWYEGLLQAVFSLEESPHRCPDAPESEMLGREIKQLIYGKRKQTYRIFFEIFEDEKIVRIYRIRHTARNWLTKEDFEAGKPLLPWAVPSAICLGCNLELNWVDSHLPFPSCIEETAPAAVYVNESA